MPAHNLNIVPDYRAIESAYHQAADALLASRGPHGAWEGRLSPSALSTATAVVALGLAARELPRNHDRYQSLLEQGIDWLVAHVNPDGGWGDTTLSKSNISTTTLVWAAFALTKVSSGARGPVLALAEQWLIERSGSLRRQDLARTIIARYGNDRTFSVPILTHCALSGRFGESPKAWSEVIPLPFELAAFPPEWFAALKLPVVSYALPALIAVGYARHCHAPSRFPWTRAWRRAVRERAFRVLTRIQPENGGFLEAIPLTSFVVMSLAGSGLADHIVTRKGLEFIEHSVEPDGSWRIDTNLSTWVTSLAVHAIASAGSNAVDTLDRVALRAWYLDQQYREIHAYTNAAPGGWAWTNLPGGVPDADDTPGALLALLAVAPDDSASIESAVRGIIWLLGLQNQDGGIPTFCRGWGKLPFDRSSADLTAHALRAWKSWHGKMPRELQTRIERAVARAVHFLESSQEPGGAWAPLWFGNEHEPDEANRVYGTSRVLLALADTGCWDDGAARAASWLQQVQKADGGWGGGPAACAPSVEETALAVESLAAWMERSRSRESRLTGAIRRGSEWLTARVESGQWRQPLPIGFYFAKLWYYEELYPVVHTVAALGRVVRLQRMATTPS